MASSRMGSSAQPLRHPAGLPPVFQVAGPLANPHEGILASRRRKTTATGMIIGVRRLATYGALASTLGALACLLGCIMAVVIKFWSIAVIDGGLCVANVWIAAMNMVLRSRYG